MYRRLTYSMSLSRVASVVHVGNNNNNPRRPFAMQREKRFSLTKAFCWKVRPRFLSAVHHCISSVNKQRANQVANSLQKDGGMLSVVSLMYANFVLEVQLNNRSSVRAVATGPVSPVSIGFLC